VKIRRWQDPLLQKNLRTRTSSLIGLAATAESVKRRT
jgi:hypothetical protein